MSIIQQKSDDQKEMSIALALSEILRGSNRELIEEEDARNFVKERYFSKTQRVHLAKRLVGLLAQRIPPTVLRLTSSHLPTYLPATFTDRRWDHPHPQHG